MVIIILSILVFLDALMYGYIYENQILCREYGLGIFNWSGWKLVRDLNKYWFGKKSNRVKIRETGDLTEVLIPDEDILVKSSLNLNKSRKISLTYVPRDKIEKMSRFEKRVSIKKNISKTLSILIEGKEEPVKDSEEKTKTV